jgi:hypothetical protein
MCSVLTRTVSVSEPPKVAVISTSMLCRYLCCSAVCSLSLPAAAASLEAPHASLTKLQAQFSQTSQTVWSMTRMLDKECHAQIVSLRGDSKVFAQSMQGRKYTSVPGH